MTATPSILYVSPVADAKGGAETVLREMLRNPRIRPSLAVPTEGDLSAHARAHGIPLHHYDLGAIGTVRRPLRVADLASAGRDALRLARQLAALAHAEGADIVHTNGMKMHVVGALARRLHGMSTVVHMHDIPYSAVERLIWRGLAAGAQHTIAASPLCYPGARLPSRVSVVMQGVDTAPATTSRILPRRPVIGFLGRFHRYKGLHLLLDWFEAVENDFPDCDLLLRGRPDPEGLAYWEALRPRAEALAARGRCRIDAWRGPGEDAFADIDILAAPSETAEVGPRVIMEAMLRGIPAIGYPRGGAPMMIPHPDLGALAGDSLAFRDALTRLADPTTYAAVSAAAIAHAAAHFGIDRFWRDLDRLYRQIAAPRAESHREQGMPTHSVSQ